MLRLTAPWCAVTSLQHRTERSATSIMQGLPAQVTTVLALPGSPP